MTAPEVEVAPMPWHPEFDHPECGDGEWAVVADVDGSVVGCHASRADAIAQIEALYAETPQSDAMIAAAYPHTGAMVAWVPSMADADRLAVAGAEPAPVLHITSLYLGNGADFTPEQQAQIVAGVTAAAGAIEGFSVDPFGVAVFNPLGAEPCAVLLAGGEALADAQAALLADASGRWPGIDLPPQRAPWIPHITLGYLDPTQADQFAMTPDLAARTAAPVAIDRLRVAFAGVVTDIPLAVAMPTPAVEPVPEELAAEEADEDMIAAAAVPMEGTPWRARIVREGIWSSSGRMFAEEALTWATPPLSLKVQLVEDEKHRGAMIAGRVDGIERTEDGWIEAWGVMDDAGQAGAEALRLGLARMLKGVSITAADIEASDVELVWPAETSTRENEPTSAGELVSAVDPVANPTSPTAVPREIYHAGRIRSLTVVAEPDFEEAEIAFDVATEPTVVVASGATNEDGSYTITIPRLYPSHWFEEPAPEEMPPFGAIQITAAGRITGWLAPPGVSHRAFRGTGRAVTVPLNIDYSEFNNKQVLVAGADGSAERIAAGTLTFDCGHASPFDPRRSDPSFALQHYENSCSVAARVRIGPHSSNGVPFVAGGLVHGIDGSTVERIMGCALSGDWQGGKLKAALFVPSEGFPVSVSASARVRDDQLVASSMPIRIQRSAGETLEQLARTIGMDSRSQMDRLRSQVEHQGR